MRNATIDADGVMFDYNEGYIRVWEKVFGYRPEVVNPNAYMVEEKYGVPRLEGAELAHFRESFDESFWRTMPFYPGVEDAIRKLATKYTLHCVTAIPHAMREARAVALAHLPFVSVVSTPVPDGWDRFTGTSPKAQAVRDLDSVLLIDDHLPFHRNVKAYSRENVLQILIATSVDGLAPDELSHIDAVHPDFVSFVDAHVQ